MLAAALSLLVGLPSDGADHVHLEEEPRRYRAIELERHWDDAEVYRSGGQVALA